MLNIIETYTSDLIIDRETNVAATICRYKESPSFCVLEIFYNDGRTETILEKIAMG